MGHLDYFLEGLSEKDIEWMISKGKVYIFRSGHALIKENCQTENLYIILDGSFAIRVSALKNQSVATAYASEVLGEMSFVDGRPTSATVEAVEGSLAFAVPGDSLERKLAGDPEFSSRFHKAVCLVLARRLRETLNPDQISPPQMKMTASSALFGGSDSTIPPECYFGSN